MYKGETIMPILTKEVEIKVNSKTVKYYKSLGYEIPMKKASKSTYKKYKKEFHFSLRTADLLD